VARIVQIIPLDAVASSFGGLLRKQELEALIARKGGIVRCSIGRSPGLAPFFVG
jgi:hypothetical protein